MPFTAGGPDAEFTVDVTVDATEAAAKLEAQFSRAMADAFKSPMVQASINQAVTNAVKAFQKIGTQQNATWKAASQGGVKAAQTIGKAFQQAGKSSGQAFNFNQARGAKFEVQALNATVQGLASTLNTAGLSAKQNLSLITNLTRSANAQARLAVQESRTTQQGVDQATRLSIVGTQQRIAADRDASNQAIQAARNRARYIIEAERNIVRAISATWTAAGKAVSAFARASIATLHGFGRTVEGIFKGIGTAISGISRGFSSIFKGLTSAASTAARGLSRIFSSSNRGDENSWRSSLRNREKALSTSLNNQSRAIQSFQQKSRTGLLGALGGGGGLAAVGGGIGLGALLSSGFQRAGDVEQLQLTFTALLGNADQAKAVLADLSQFARTTSFDFIEVAQSTAQLTAALGDVGKAEHLTKFLADVVSLTGGTTEALGRVRLAFSQIAGAGRLDSANLRQITESLPGVPIAQILADRFFGGSVEAYSAARDAGELGGKISAEAFFQAFEDGTKEKFPAVEGFAQVAAGTLTGLTQNLKENFAIFGATIIDLVKGPIKNGINALNTFLGLAGDFVSGKLTTPTESRPLGGSWESFTHGLTDAQEKLKLFRDILGNVLKALGGLLALKVGAEIFGLLGSAVRLALTPMGLLVIAVTGLTAAWTFFNRTNERFAATWKTVTGQLRPAIDAFKRLGTALKNAFSGGGGGDGKPSFLTRIGDALRYVNVGLARVVAGFRIFADTLTNHLNARGFDNFLDSLDDAFGNGLFELFYGPDADHRRDQIKAQGGSFILNILEGTFLGPVVRFFRGPFLNIAKTITGFIGTIATQIGSAVGDIWGIIFGKDTDATDEMTNQLFGTGDDRSKGTKILDRLEETFLGPVIRFFRGPFADAIRGISGFISDLFGDFIIPGAKAVVGFFAHDFIPGIIAVGKAIGSFLAPAVGTVGNLLGQVGTLLAPVGGAIQGFVETWKTEGVSKAFSSLWDGIAATASNLWDGEDGNGGIKAGLESARDSITDWFSTTFTGKNVAQWGLLALGGIRLVGEKIGRFLASPEFLGTVIITAAAVAGAIAAIIGAFTTGLIQGIAAEVPRWAKLISGGLTKAWDSLSSGALSFLPDPVVNAISAMLSNPVLGTGIGAGAVALGGVILAKVAGGIATAAKDSSGKNATSFAGAAGNIVTSLFTGIRNGLIGVKNKQGSGGLLGGFRSLGAMIFGSATGTDTGAQSAGRQIGGGVLGGVRLAFTNSAVGSAVTNLKNKLQTAAGNARTQYGSVGTAIATAIVGGIADFEINRAAGASGSTGSKLLGLLFGTVSGAAFGASIGGPVGAVVGGVVGGGIAILGQHFGEAAAKAQKFDDIVRSIRESLSGLDADAQRGALLTNIADRLTESTDAFGDWGSALANSQFDFQNFVDQILAGSATADSAFADFVTGLKDQLLATGDVAPDVLQHFTDSLTLAAKSGNFTNLTDLMNEAFKGLSDSDIRSIADAFDTIDFTGIIDGTGDANNAFKFLKDTINGATAAQVSLAAQADITSGHIDTVFSKTYTNNGPEKAAADVSNEFINTKSQIDIAQEAIDKFFDSGAFATSARAATDALTLQISGLPDAVSNALSGVSGQANIDATLDQLFGGVSDQVSDALSKAISEGTVTDAASLAAFNTQFVDPIIAAIQASPLSQDVKNTLIEGLNELGGIDALNLVQQKAAAVAAAVKTTLHAELKKNPVTADDLLGGSPAATGSGGTGGPAGFGTSFATTIITGITTAVRKAAPDVSSGFRKNLIERGTDTDIAKTFAGGLKVALISSALVAVQGGRAVGSAAANGVKSASVEFFAAGINAGRAFSLGLLAQVAAAASAARAIASAATNSAKKTLKVASPSKVFVDIGTQVGRGFIQGIKDSEGDMAQAMSDALEGAVTKGVKKAGVAVQRAQAAGGIFDLLSPSILPGGTTDASRLSSTLDLRGSILDFAGSQRSNASSALSGLGRGSFVEARDAAAGLALDLKAAREGIQSQVDAAAEANKALYTYNTTLAALDKARKAGTLGQGVYNTKLADLKEQLSLGSITQKAFDQKLKELNYSLSIGRLNTDEYAKRLKDLGDKPAELTAAQLSVRSTGSSSLAAGTVAGDANRSAIADAINTIKSFGQAAIEAGTPLATVIAQMKGYRATLLAQTKALGLSQSGVLSLIDAFGLSDKQLTAFQKTLTSLNQTTPEGIENARNILTQLIDIRNFGKDMLESGVSQASVVAQLKTFRDAFIKQATGAGFSKAEITKLVEAVGLSDSALANFTKQLQAFDNAAKNAAATADAAAKAAAAKAAADKAASDKANGVDPTDTSSGGVGRAVGELHVHVPYGDPEAVSLAVVNRLAYGDLTSWS